VPSGGFLSDKSPIPTLRWRIQDSLAKLNIGVLPDVPQGGVVWVFALRQ